jgi:hypothetical protein
MRLDLPLILQVALVGDDHDGEVILIFHLEQESALIPHHQGLQALRFL